MQYYKFLVFMDGERTRVTPEQFQAYLIAKQRGDRDIVIDGNMFALSSVSRTEDSSEPVYLGIALPGSVDPNHKHEPQYIEADDGYRPYVRAILIKKKFPRRYYEKWLAPRTSQYLVEVDGNWVWVAFKHVPCKVCGITVEDAIECEPEEYARFGWRDNAVKA
jgi:hypothetical protein